MKLQTKILILLTAVLGILLVSFLSYQYIQFHEKKILNQENRKNQESIIDKVLQINKIRSEQLLYDNSGWDDMVSFIAKPDLVWSKDNVDFLVNSFKSSFVLVYNKEKELIYKYGDSVCLNGLKYPDQEMINRQLTSAPFSHYFQYSSNQLIEIFGAIVVPSSDADARNTPPQGYLFIGRKWDADYLKEHGEATGYEVKFSDNYKPETFQEDPSKIYFFKKIPDYSGETIGTLIFSKNDDLQYSLKHLYNLSILSIVLSLFALAIFLYYFRKIILGPLQKVSKALYSKDIDTIESLKSNNDEFRILANLICDFFAQQDALRDNNLKLEEINVTKDRLFSIIAHDLKNPVGSTVALSDLLLNYLKNKELETAEELAIMLAQQSKETLALLTSLFDWARSQTGQMVFSPDLYDFMAVANKVINNLLHSAQMKEITILPVEASNIKVFADLHMLKTVLRNLITNAIKFTSAGGTITVSAVSREKMIEISVADTGIGMSEEIRQKLFKIESNLTLLGTAKEKGNGLGLIICKELIEKHGGTIRVESKLNVGSRFIFTLPGKNSE